MQVLIIGYVWPEPRSSAAGSHMMQLIEQFLSQGWRVTFASPSQPGETRADLTALGVKEATIELNHDSFDTYVKGLAPDIVVFDRFMMEEQFGWRVAAQCPQALRVLEMSDMHSLRDTRQRCPAPVSAEALYTAMATQDITQRELASIYRSDISLVISSFEMALLVKHFRVPEPLLCYCPFLLDMPDPAGWRGYHARKGFISIGNFRHAPNWDAVLWLKQKIWPLLRKELPQAECFIYGAYTPQKAFDLHNIAEGFHVMGWAEDALAVMQQARVCLAPLRFGAGLKGKLFDAMMTGTPFVTTAIGIEGIGIEGMGSEESGVDQLACADANAIVDRAVVLYQQADRWSAAQQQGLALLQAFEKQKVGRRLLEKILSVCANLEQHRCQNFTGLMLQHHQHKSTTYMARWIAAKNQLAREKAGENSGEL